MKTFFLATLLLSFVYAAVYADDSSAPDSSMLGYWEKTKALFSSWMKNGRNSPYHQIKTFLDENHLSVGEPFIESCPSGYSLFDSTTKVGYPAFACTATSNASLVQAITVSSNGSNGKYITFFSIGLDSASGGVGGEAEKQLWSRDRKYCSSHFGNYFTGLHNIGTKLDDSAAPDFLAYSFIIQDKNQTERFICQIMASEPSYVFISGTFSAGNN